MHAAKALAGKHLTDRNAWYQTDHRSPAHFMGRHCRDHHLSPVPHARGCRPAPQAARDKAFRSGVLTDEKVIDLAFAAAIDPTSEEGLLVLAEAASLEEFPAGCARVRHAASSESQRHARAHRRRHLRHWINLDGEFRLSGSCTPEAGAQILAAVEPYRHKVADRSSRRGRKGRAPAGAVLAEALLEMATHDRTAGEADSGPRAMIHVRLDDEAMMRGYLQPGEICEVPGVGPISVAEANGMLGDAIVSGVVMDNTDIRNVIKMGRVIPARMETALVEQDQCCAVPGCGERHGLEKDHVVPVHQGGPTSLYNLCRLCG